MNSEIYTWKNISFKHITYVKEFIRLRLKNLIIIYCVGFWITTMPKSSFKKLSTIEIYFISLGYHKTIDLLVGLEM